MAGFEAAAHLALAPCYFTYDFEEVILPDCSLLMDKNYAHNPPTGQMINPADDSQVITLTFRYLSNNVAQSGKSVIWYYNPRSGGPGFFDAQNAPLSINPQGNIFTTTDPHGLSVLKIGSTSPFLGSISAVPNDDPDAGARQVQIVVATFNAGDYDSRLDPAIYSPNPIVIPDKFSPADPGFEVRMPPLQTIITGQSIVFWLSSGAPGETPQERIKLVNVDQAQQGITAPYSDVYPDPNETGYNSISYMVVQPTTSNCIIARPVIPEVIGKPASNHPDYSNTNRTLPSPHLNNFTTSVTGDTITNGLNVYIPYSTAWVTDNIINLKLYLNGEDDTGKIIGNTVTQQHVITDAQVSAKTDIAIYFAQDQLAGYNSGTLEADYYIGADWSVILENITLGTGTWVIN